MKTTLIIILLSLGSVAKVNAQAPDPDTTARHFVIIASIGNLQEIVSGNLALQKAMNAHVKDFARQMVSDHSKAQAQLLAVAKAQHINIPPQASGQQLPDPMLLKASGADFDRIYVHMMAPDHQETVQRFETYAVGGKNVEVKKFAQQTLPLLKQHLASINAINNEFRNLSAK